MRRSLVLLAGAVLVATATATACGKGPGVGDSAIPAMPVEAIPGHESLQDNSPKEGPRLLPGEVYLRTINRMLGDVTPLEAEAIMRADEPASLFDRWADYIASLGLPDYQNDVNRAVSTNSLMVATCERLAIAVCIRTAEKELRPGAPPIEKRKVYAFDPTPNPPTDAEFDARFDVLHRTFLGYPAHLAETTDRSLRFRNLYRQAVARGAGETVSRKLTPTEQGWVAVCYGLARHPEFHLY